MSHYIQQVVIIPPEQLRSIKEFNRPSLTVKNELAEVLPTRSLIEDKLSRQSIEILNGGKKRVYFFRTMEEINFENASSKAAFYLEPNAGKTIDTDTISALYAVCLDGESLIYRTENMYLPFADDNYAANIFGWMGQSELSLSAQSPFKWIFGNLHPNTEYQIELFKDEVVVNTEARTSDSFGVISLEGLAGDTAVLVPGNSGVGAYVLRLNTAVDGSGDNYDIAVNVVV